MFPELRQWITEHNAKYVLMDSMVSLFGGGADLNETEIGTYMYLLNSLAAECGCAIVLTHHLRKSNMHKAGPRSDIGMQDLYGSAFIVRAPVTSGASSVIPTARRMSPSSLKVPATDRCDARGDTFLLSGSTEDLSFQIETLNNGDTNALNKLREGFATCFTCSRAGTRATQ